MNHYEISRSLATVLCDANQNNENKVWRVQPREAEATLPHALNEQCFSCKSESEQIFFLCLFFIPHLSSFLVTAKHRKQRHVYTVHKKSRIQTLFRGSVEMQDQRRPSSRHLSSAFFPLCCLAWMLVTGNSTSDPKKSPKKRAITKEKHGRFSRRVALVVMYCSLERRSARKKKDKADIEIDPRY